MFRLSEWVSLGVRLMVANPRKYRQVVSAIREMVEGQELIAKADRTLVLRAERPTKVYQA